MGVGHSRVFAFVATFAVGILSACSPTLPPPTTAGAPQPGESGPLPVAGAKCWLDKQVCVTEDKTYDFGNTVDMKTYMFILTRVPTQLPPDFVAVMPEIVKDWRSLTPACVTVGSYRASPLGNSRVSNMTANLVSAGIPRNAILESFLKGEGVPGGDNQVMVNVHKTKEPTCPTADTPAVEPPSPAPPKKSSCDVDPKSPASQENGLGILYNNGWGVARNPTEAARRFRNAAEQGSCAAMINLGSMYEEGTSIPKDMTQARFWMKKAADAGDEAAQKWLAAH
jgi:hypothetical protein